VEPDAEAGMIDCRTSGCSGQRSAAADAERSAIDVKMKIKES